MIKFTAPRKWPPILFPGALPPTPSVWQHTSFRREAGCRLITLSPPVLGERHEGRRETGFGFALFCPRSEAPVPRPRPGVQQAS